MTSPEYGLILLAAGGSSRMGTPKQLLDFGGKTMIRRAVETALATSCTRVAVVLGANAAQIRPALDGVAVGGKTLSVVDNLRWAEGMGTSIQVGLTALEPFGCAGSILTLADLPGITPAILNRLIDEHERTQRPIIASAYAQTVGVPVFFARAYFGQLMALAPDQGCKSVILKSGAAALRLPCAEAEADIDTPADYDANRR